MRLHKLFLLFALLFLSASASAQTAPTGVLRGTVTDAASGRPLPRVSVSIQGTGTLTDQNGTFALPPMPVGRHNIMVSLMGYEPASLREVQVQSSKETVLNIALKESVQAAQRVVVRPRVNKEQALNTMTLVGARMFSVDEANRYAGGLDDPARLATAFAGAAGSVTSNAISVRGNSPQLLQWRLEEVEIPNPSHYPEIGAVGGGILTAFSSNVLGNSDFLMGAFPAQYSNALSGVFDMSLRNGNNQTWEHTASLGTLGVEFGSEGPFKRGGQGSYLFNYRYSSMALASDLMGGSMKEVAGMRYQDLSFKVNLPTSKAGIFSLWGIATNDSYIEALPDDPAKESYQPSESGSRQYMAAFGISHRIFVGSRSYLKTSLAGTTAFNHIWHDYYRGVPLLERVSDLRDNTTNAVLSTYLNTKFTARHTNRTGAAVTNLFFDNDYNIAPGYPFPTGPMANFNDSAGESTMVSAFTQSVWQLNERLMGEAGVTGTYFGLNGHWTLEPRASLRWQAFERHAFGIASGMHSRHERLGNYFVTVGGQQVNKNLHFAKALHLTASWDFQISEDVHLRLEPYFQFLFDLPVAAGTNESPINQTYYFMDKHLVGGGKGRNMGVDLTLERYLRGGWYYMLTASLFDSRYAVGGQWFNTRFNRRFAANALGGKEWIFGRNSLGVNLRANFMGGEHYTPLDEAASLAAQAPIEDAGRMMQSQNPTTLVVHATINYTLHRPKITHELGFKMINITGSKEYWGYDYNLATHQLDHMSTNVGIPNIYYRVAF